MESNKLYPSPAWFAAFRQEATPQTMQAAVRCAEIEVSRLHRLEIPVAWDEEDLVQRILAATCGGKLAWNPDKATLRAHLRDKIRLTCRRLRKRRRRGRSTTVIELDALNDEDPLWADVGLSTNTTEAVAAVSELARRLESELWQLAEGDQIALRVLAAMSEGETSNVELAAKTELPVRTVEYAKSRLQRLGSHVSPALLADIRDELNLDASCDGSCDDGALDRSDDGLE